MLICWIRILHTKLSNYIFVENVDRLYYYFIHTFYGFSLLLFFFCCRCCKHGVEIKLSRVLCHTTPWIISYYCVCCDNLLFQHSITLMYYAVLVGYSLCFDFIFDVLTECYVIVDIIHHQFDHYNVVRVSSILRCVNLVLRVTRFVILTFDLTECSCVCYYLLSVCG